jgi:hypothetical protein
LFADIFAAVGQAALAVTCTVLFPFLGLFVLLLAFSLV